GSVKAFGTGGKIFWDYKESGRFLPYLTRSRSASVYFARTTGDFIALNRAGVQQWRLNLKAPITAPPVSGWDERIFIFLESSVLCYTASGHKLWQRELSASLAGDPQLDALGGVLMFLTDNTIVSLSPFGEKSELKLYSAPAFVLPLPAKKGTRAPLVRTLVIYPDGRLELYNADGEAQADITHLGSAALAASTFKNFAAVQLNTGTLALLDADSGTILWRTPSQPGVGAAGNRAQRIHIQFDEARGSIYVLSVTTAAGFSKDGDMLWSVKTENAAASAAFDEGRVYSGTKNWILNAWDAENRGEPSLTRSSLPVQGRYGLGQLPSRKEWNFWTQAFNGNYNQLLAEIAKQINAGGIGSNEAPLTRVLNGIAVDVKIIQTDRVEALRLLGIIGSRESAAFLARRFINEAEVSVQAEMALSLGRIGSDAGGVVLDAFSRVIETTRSSRYDGLRTAMAAALGAMCKFSGPPVSERGVKLLVAIANESAAPNAAQKARSELDLLMR
ncbi:MAG: hypothetical protein LBC77_09445, partial [Spirochaetaceae bacterium]|nr:hypothetical protein [Spirochaetaceae bacterium]